jgi:hypothetical protein
MAIEQWNEKSQVYYSELSEYLGLSFKWRDVLKLQDNSVD